MYTIKYTKAFTKDVKRCQKRGLDLGLLVKAVDILRVKGELPKSYKAHKLNAQFNFCWECHLQPDWLLMWEQNDMELLLTFTGTGTHSDIFK